MGEAHFARLYLGFSRDAFGSSAEGVAGRGDTKKLSEGITSWDEAPSLSRPEGNRPWQPRQGLVGRDARMLVYVLPPKWLISTHAPDEPYWYEGLRKAGLPEE
jgi:hypothetical protein